MQKGNVPQQVVTLVKTSTGMTLATLPKNANLVQPKISGVMPQQSKNTVVKIVPANATNKQMLTTVKTIPSNMIQMNKATGKLVLSKSATGQIPTLNNQQVLVVSSGTGNFLYLDILLIFFVVMVLHAVNFQGFVQFRH